MTDNKPTEGTTKLEDIIESIDLLPKSGRVYLDAGGRGQIKTNATAADLKLLATEYKRLKAAATIKRQPGRRPMCMDVECMDTSPHYAH